MDEKEEHKKDENEVNDPSASYGVNKNRIVFFNSYEEENEYTAKKAAEKNPIQGLKETVELILRVYGFTPETLKKRQPNNEIIIDRQ